MRLVPDGWAAQAERLARTYKRFRATVGTGQTREFEDALFHCCHDAWALHDWLVADPDVAAEAKAVVAARVEAAFPLRIARDLAHGAKHLTLTRETLAEARVGERMVDVYLRDGEGPGPDVRLACRWEIQTKGGSLDAEDLLCAVVREWCEVLRAAGLEVPPTLAVHAAPPASLEGGVGGRKRGVMAHEQTPDAGAGGASA